MAYLKILGPPEISIDGQPVRLFKKPMALITYLFVESNRPHTRSYLSDLLWPEVLDKKGDNSLRQSLHLLRAKLSTDESDPVILTTPKSVQLNPKLFRRLDSSGFFHPSKDCDILHDPQECPDCREQITETLLSIRGPVFEGLSFPECEELQNWITAIQEGLIERSRWAIDRIVSLLEKEHQPGIAVRLLDHFLKMDPLDEERARTQIAILGKMGNVSAAQNRYVQLRKSLKSELDVEPDTSTKDLIERVLSGPSVFPKTSSAPVSGLENTAILEWRQATALVIDLHQADAYEAISDTSPILKIFLKTVQRFGSVECRINDYGFLAWFGTDGEPDRASLLAAKAALEIGRIFERTRKTGSGKVELRGGVHTGRVLKSPDSNSTDPVGTVSKSAAALCMQAAPDSILVSSDTYHALRGSFPHATTKPVTLLKRQTTGYLLPISCDQEKHPFPEPPFLMGRKMEKQIFHDLYANNRGGVLLMEGEAGIGKTALAHSCILDGVRSGADFRTIECFPHHRNLAFFPLSELIRADSGDPSESDPTLSERQLSEYAQSLRIGTDSDFFDLLRALLSFSSLPDDTHFTLLSSTPPKKMRGLLVKILNAWAERHPLIILAEDLHWCDASTGKLLAEVLRDPTLSKRIFFILTFRNGEGPDWISSIPASGTICLNPLAQKHSWEMVRAIFHDRGLSEQEMRRIASLGDGLPLYIKEIAREHIESFGKNRRTLISIGEIVESRLTRLGSSRSLPLLASVVGHQVPVDLLRTLVPMAPKSFETHLDSVIRSKILHKSSSPFVGWKETLVFRHSLVRETVLRSLHPKTLAEIHRTIAVSLREHFPEQANNAPLIVAFHFDQSGEKGEAALWYEKAGEIALSKGEIEAAEQSLRQGLTLLSALPSSSKVWQTES
ncbi:MAG: AAA family ATPase [Leptospirales bacterium]